MDTLKKKTKALIKFQVFGNPWFKYWKYTYTLNAGNINPEDKRRLHNVVTSSED